MSFSSKRTITSVVSEVLLILAYAIYAVVAMPAGAPLRSWAVVLLIFMGIGIVVIIAIQILFHIGFAIRLAAKEHTQERMPDKNVERELSSDMVEDEMGKLIGLKAGRVGRWVTLAGLIVFLVTLAVGTSPVVGLHVIVGGFAVAGIVDGIAAIWFYEKGTSDGNADPA